MHKNRAIVSISNVVRTFTTSNFISLLTIFIFMFSDVTHAKSKLDISNATEYSKSRYSSLSEFQRHIKKALRNTSIRNQGKLPPQERISESDLFYLTKVWSQLDNATKNAYLASSIIPDTAVSYITPGGHFEIFYVTKHLASHLNGDNYSFNVHNWRNKDSSPNGIPDYVDEIGWALDSCWELEVSKMNFIHPIPYEDSLHKSTKYKVLAFDSPDFGYTYPFPADKSKYPKGWSSIIDMTTNWTAVGYSTKPLDAIRVTCAHEFFHSIQFSMTWNVIDGSSFQIDDFPFAWLEGTAAAMEDIAFTSVNDYIHYSMSYFNSPDRPFLHDNDIPSGFQYTNSLLMLHITKILSPDDIDFTRKLMFANYTQPTPFYNNIRATAATYNTSWTSILHNYHVGSFFTGKYSDTSRFLSDAAQFDTIKYQVDSSANSEPIIKSVYPYAMKTFTWQQSTLQTDYLRINLEHRNENTSAADVPWDASVIKIRNGVRTITHIDLTKSGDGSYVLNDLKPLDKVVVIVTNGHALKTNDYAVSFSNCPSNVSLSNPFIVTSYANDLSNFAQVNFSYDVTPSCIPTISTSQNQAYTDNATLKSLTQISSAYSITIPYYWRILSRNDLTITLPNHIDSASYAMYMWIQSTSSWEKVAQQTKLLSHDTLSITTSNITTGIFAILRSIDLTKTSLFPNPVSLKSSSLTIAGSNIKRLLIYDASGILVYNKVMGNAVSLFNWKLQNNQNKKIVPGLYLSIIEYADSRNTKQFVKQKVLVTP